MVVSNSLSYRVEHRDILKDLTFSIERGEAIGVLGCNGSGKSSLVKIIDALIRPSGGKLEVAGYDVFNIGNKYQIHTKVSFIFQNPASFSVGATVREDIEFTLENFNIAQDERAEAVSDALLKVGLSGFEDRSVNTLSGGEKQKLAISSILAIDTPMIIFDEALCMLDNESKEEITSIIRALRQEGRTVIYITHESDSIIDYDKVLLLKDGEIKAFDEPSKVLTDTGLLGECGIKIPFYVRLYHDLKENGINLNSIPLSRSDFREALCSLK